MLSISELEIALSRVLGLLKQTQRTSYQGLIPPRIQFRHVKAHTRAQDARSWVNRWCDREAKIKMREESKKILEKEA
jgi:hypothetical protein